MIKYGDVLTDRNVIREIERANRVEKNLDHGMDHSLFVVRITDYVLNKLDFSQEYINIAKIAALLHDIGKKKGEHGHAKRSADMTVEYLKDKDISNEYKKEIYDAIANHSDPKKILSPMHACLVLGDKIDLKKTRLFPSGYKDKVTKDIQYIINTKLDIIKKRDIKTMEINYETTDEFDKTFFNISPKYIYLPRMVADYFNIDIRFKIKGEEEAFDNKIWFSKEKLKEMGQKQ